MSQPLEKLLTPKDVGAVLEIHPKTARRLRDFPWKNIGIGKRPVPRVSRTDFETWLANRKRVA